MASVDTFRSDVVGALVSVLQAQATATPTLLRGVWSSRPGSFNELPLAYVGSRDETLTWDSGTWTRTMSGLQVVLVDAYADAAQTNDRLDDLVDALALRFNNVTSTAIPTAILQLNTVTDTELAVENGQSTTYYRAVVLGFPGTFRSGGRD